MARILTGSSLRKIVNDIFGNIERDNVSLAAIVVLISAGLLETIDVGVLTHFTGYPRKLLNAIAANMVNNRFWEEGRYKAAPTWLKNGGAIGENIAKDDEFVDHYTAACGDTQSADAHAPGVFIEVPDIQ